MAVPRLHVQRTELSPRERPDESPRSTGSVVQLPVAHEDAAIVRAFGDDAGCARAALYDRYAPLVERLLYRLVGSDPDLDVEDLLHDTFISAFSSIHTVDEPHALGKWIRTIAARTAYAAVRRKRRGRWLRFWEPANLQTVRASNVDPETLEAYRRTQALIQRLPAKERIPFVLKYVEGMALGEIAEACDVSLATAKRRIKSARERFVGYARDDDALRAWLVEGNRWTT